MKKKRYAIVYIPRVRESVVKTVNIKKYVARMMKGDVEKIYSVVDLTNCRKVEL